MKNWFIAMLAISISVMFTASAFAADSLAYKDGFFLGVVTEENTYKFGDIDHDYDDWQLKSRSTGVKVGYGQAASGFGMAASYTGEQMDTDNELNGNDTSAIQLEISKRVHDFGDGLQLGIYGKAKYYFGKLEQKESSTYDVWVPDGDTWIDVGDGMWNHKTEISDVKIWELGLIAQKDWQHVHLYGGPMIQMLRANMNYSYSHQEDNGYSSSDDWSSEYREKQLLGAVAGITVDVTEHLSVNLNITAKDHTSTGGNLTWRF